MYDLIAIVIVLISVLFIILIRNIENLFLKRVFNWFPPILFAYLIPALITNFLNLDLSNVFIHNFSKGFIIPIAIICVMSAMSLSQLKIVGFKPLVLFLSGSLIIALLPPLLVFITKFIDIDFYTQILDEEIWKGLVTIVGSWIGGSTSQLVLKELVNCSEELFVSVLVIDNILVNIWTITMFQNIRRSDKINKILKIDDEKPKEIERIDLDKKNTSILLTFIIIFLISFFFYFLQLDFLITVISLSFIGILIGNIFDFWSFQSTLKFGEILILVIMSILGLKLNFQSLYIPNEMIILSIVWLLLHYIGMTIVAWKLNLHAAWIPIASMANLGGISTAPAVTAAYEKKWMPHAIVLSILSMVTGTMWGVLTIFIFERFI